MNSVAFYQPCDSAAGDRERLTLQWVPDLSDAVDLIVLFPETLDFKAQIPVPFGAIRRQVRVSGDRYMRIKIWTGRLAKPCKPARHPSLRDALL